MNKFEYTVLEVPKKGFLRYKTDFEALTTKLNELGRKGWEVTAMNHSSVHQGTGTVLIILKRALTH